MSRVQGLVADAERTDSLYSSCPHPAVVAIRRSSATVRAHPSNAAGDTTGPWLQLRAPSRAVILGLAAHQELY